LLTLFTLVPTSVAMADASALGIDHYINELHQSLAAPRANPRVLRLKVSGRSDNLNIDRVAAQPSELSSEAMSQSVQLDALTHTLSSGADIIPSVLIEIWRRLVVTILWALR